MRLTDPRTTIMIDQFFGGVETCPNCGRIAVGHDAKNPDPDHSLFFNLKTFTMDFNRNAITAVHRPCGKRFELTNWRLK